MNAIKHLVFILLSSLLPVVNGEIYQAEKANVIHECMILTRHEGYEGSGYADFNGVGSFLMWMIDVAQAGSYEVTIRYAAKTNRPLDLVLDGSKVAVVASSATGDWKTWVSETTTVFLSEQEHSIKLLAKESLGPNIDSISVVFVDKSPITVAPIPTPAPYWSPRLGPTLENLPVSAVRRLQTPVYYDPQTAILHNVTILQQHDGYERGAYGDYDGVGSYLEWTITIPETEVYDITLRYASKNARQLDVLVDDTAQGTIANEATGEWNQWMKETLIVYLNAGTYSLKLLAATSPGPNVDWLSIQRATPSPSPTFSPTSSSYPSFMPTSSSYPTTPPQTYDKAVVLESNTYLSIGDFVSSPSGDFQVGLSSVGDLVLLNNNSEVIWAAGVTNGTRCYMQSDGNLIVRDINQEALWRSKTHKHPGAVLIVDDGGYIAVMYEGNLKWFDGIPRGQYVGPPNNGLSFPARGVFYYPWYPETWTVNGNYSHFVPTIGRYSSSDPEVAAVHVDALDYANVDLSIASWWGPNTKLDRARLTMLMDETLAQGSEIKWTVYHEDERDVDPSIQALRQDLDYLKKWFAWHPAWAHINGKPVIFVYNEGDCEVASRWMAAANGEWFVVLKLFGGYKTCNPQPSHWHQYGVGDGYLEHDGASTTIAPGFWRADESEPSFPRLSPLEWCNNVEKMVNSGEPLQLIVSYNEAGEGTMIESSLSWTSNTTYGSYLDCLHQYA